jgi:homoisocitrate dehydrogenase
VKIAILAGDGIGPEVTAQAVRVFETMSQERLLENNEDIELQHAAIGYGAYLEHGTPLPQATLQLVRACDATLLGAVTTPANIENYRSPVLRLRQELELYACIRPVRSLDPKHSNIDLCIVRENTEGLYSGVERSDGQRAVTERVITRKGSERIVRYAAELARRSGLKNITVVHKANVLRETCGLFRKVAFEVANEAPDLSFKEMLVDTCAMELIRAPEQFEVIVTTNLFGDILSDEASMLAGGLGMASSANIGADAAVFEPVHGSAPDLVGRELANPLATFGAMVLLLRHLQHDGAATRLEQAIHRVFQAKLVTPDLGGKLRSSEVTEAVISGLQGAV